MLPTQRQKETATRLAFFVTGLVPAAWAPLIPFAKARLGADNASLGLLLLCLGIGSMIAMPVTGMFMARIGTKRAVLIGGVTFVLLLPALAVLDNFALMALALAVIGAAVGTVDVAMNLQAVVVEREAGRPMMSGFHGQYSFGGIVGAASVSALLLHPDPLLAACVVCVFGLILLALAAPGLLRHVAEEAQEPAVFVLPRGLVLFTGVLCFLCFMAEGVVLDWSAVFLKTERAASASLAGTGFAVFAAAMTVSRFLGDSIRARLGERDVLLFGGAVAAIGFSVVIFAPLAAMSLFGFLLIGVGASNIVPVLVTITGRTTTMPGGLAIASVTTLGYAGILAGPAVIGFIAHGAGLSVAFGFPALAMVVIAASYAIGKSDISKGNG